VSALRFTWLATSCGSTDDTLELTVNGATLARVTLEPAGSHCSCTPFVAVFDAPLPRVLALLGPGVNRLGIRKNTGLPAEARTALAWAYATLTVGGVPQRVELFDANGGGDFDSNLLCAATYTFDAVDVELDTPPLPPAALSQPWTGELPCMVDVAGLAPNSSYLLLVAADDGVVATPSADARAFTHGSESTLAINVATACDDGDACTVDTCTPGGCVHSAVVCAGGDQCHDAATCDPATGACTPSTKPDGTACNDGNACTTADTCQAGACTGASPVVCGAPDQCHDAGVCNPATGTCSSPAKPDGAACDDGDACTTADSCQAGACTGASPSCAAPPISATRRASATRRRTVLEPRQVGRRRLQRRQRLHDDGHLPGRRLHRDEPRRLRRGRPVPRRRRLRPRDRDVLRAERAGGHDLRRRQRLHGRRRVPGGRVPSGVDGGMRRARRLSRGILLEPGKCQVKRILPASEACRRTGTRRSERRRRPSALGVGQELPRLAHRVLIAVLLGERQRPLGLRPRFFAGAAAARAFASVRRAPT
jgi:hypothetical protein